MTVQVFTSSQRIHRITFVPGHPPRTVNRRIEDPVVRAVADRGQTAYLHHPPDLPLAEAGRDRLAGALAALVTPAPANPGTGEARRCPGTAEEVRADTGLADQLSELASLRGVALSRLVVERQQVHREFTGHGHHLECVHAWNRTEVHGGGATIEIFHAGAVRWDWVLDELILLAPSGEPTRAEPPAGEPCRLAPKATAALVQAIAWTSTRNGSAPPVVTASPTLRVGDDRPDVPFGHCFDIDGVASSSPSGGRTTLPYTPIPVARPTVLTMDLPTLPDLSGPIVEYTGTVVTDLAEAGHGDFLSGSHLFLRACGVRVQRGAVTGVVSPWETAVEVADVLSSITEARPDGGWCRADGVVAPRLWLDAWLG